MASSDLPPRFFKVYISQFSSDSMMIPLSYYDELPSHLPKTAILQGTGGCVWKVAMKEKQDEIHFEKGWTKFVKDNSLVDGDFLTFVYDGDCVFEVSIYGLDTYKETRAVATEVKDEDGKEDTVTSLSSEDTEKTSPVPRNMNKEKPKVEVEEDSDERDDDSYRKKDTKGKMKEEAVESSDGDSDSDDSDYIGAFGRLDVSNDSNSDSSYSRESKGTTAIVKTTEKKEMFLRVVRKIKNPEAYMDNPENIYLETGVKNRKYELLVDAQLVHDYELKFADKVVYMDKYGKLVAKTVKWADQRVCIKRWGNICERNKVKRKDRILCEFLRKGKLVYAVKVHIIRARFL